MIVLQILLILAIMYTGLALYFQHRLEKKNKQWQKKLKRTQNLKKN